MNLNWASGVQTSLKPMAKLSTLAETTDMMMVAQICMANVKRGGILV